MTSGETGVPCEAGEGERCWQGCGAAGLEWQWWHRLAAPVLVPPHSWCSPGAAKGQARLSVEKLEGKKAGAFSSSFVEVLSLTSDTER